MSGASEKCFEVTSSSTSDKAFLEYGTNAAFIVNLPFEKKQMSLLECHRQKFHLYCDILLHHFYFPFTFMPFSA